jgi:hypothetical protein
MIGNTSHCKYHTHPLHIRFFTETSHVPLFVSNSPLRVPWFKYPVVDSEATRAGAVSLWPYLVMFGVMTTPYDVICTQIWRYISKRFRSLRGHSWSSLAAGVCPNISSKFLCDRSLSTSSTSYKACPSESGTEVWAPLFPAVELCDFSGRWQCMSGEIWYTLDSGSVLVTEAEAT